MKHGLMHAFGFVTAALLALGAGPAAADAVGPYYATPSWDQTLPASTRFIVLSNLSSAAVLDRETGLVWLQAPGTQAGFGNYQAMSSDICPNIAVGNRLGWRLPTMQEMLTLIDASISSGIALPAGHPFTNVRGGLYWTATHYWFDATQVYVVSLSNMAFPPSRPEFVFGTIPANSDTQLNAWCVRSAQVANPQ